MNYNIKILILNWNGSDVLMRCLESVYNIDYDNFDVIVVDNGSSDDSIINIHNNFPEVQIVALNHNYGYSKGYNKAFGLVDNSEDSFFMLLNNDTVVDKNILNHFIDACNTIGSKECILGPKIYYMDDKSIWYSGGEVDLSLGILRHKGIRGKDFDSDSLEDTGYITGCCMFTHKSNINKLGGFDESFNMYCEDVDLSLRALSEDIRCIYVPQASIWHEVSNSFGSEFNVNKISLKFFSSWKLFSKHLSPWMRYYGFLLLLIRSLISGIKLLFITKNKIN